MSSEADNLRVLSIFHYVIAGLAALFSMFPVLHIFMGAMMVAGRLEGPAPPGSDLFGWFFIAMGSFFVLAGLTFSACYAYAGLCLARCQSYMYCLVMSGIGCAFFPFGTVLGVFTILELQKEPVRQLFGRK
jgi:hypothetical protein